MSLIDITPYLDRIYDLVYDQEDLHTFGNDSLFHYISAMKQYIYDRFGGRATFKMGHGNEQQFELTAFCEFNSDAEMVTFVMLVS